MQTPVTGLKVTQASLVNFNAVNIFSRVTPSNFWIVKAGRQRLCYTGWCSSFTAPVATADEAPRRTPDLSASTARARHSITPDQHRHRHDPMAFTAKFRQLTVKIFPGLAEKFIRISPAYCSEGCFPALALWKQTCKRDGLPAFPCVTSTMTVFGGDLGTLPSRSPATLVCR